jgi:hypothetical protein
MLDKMDGGAAARRPATADSISPDDMNDEVPF